MFKQLLTAAALVSLIACAGTKGQTSDDGEVAAAPVDDSAARAAAEAAGYRVFGAAPAVEGFTAVAAVLEDPKAYAGKDVVIGGEIRQVCQKMGCWFELSAGADVVKAIRVTSPNHDILIPTDSMGHSAVAMGELVAREVTEEEAEHYRSEGAAAEAGMELTLKMTGVAIQ